MRSVYIMDECQSSRKNGIGTYVRELVDCLSNVPNYKFTKINFNADFDEFEIDAKTNDIFIPQFQHGNFIDHPEAVSAILAINITDSQNNIFIVNHSPCTGLIIAMKEVFPLSKFVFVIHDMCWTARLMGDSKLLYSIENSNSNGLQYRIEQEKDMMEVVDYIICLNNDTLSVLQNIYAIDTDNKVFVAGNGLTRSSITTESRIMLRKELYLIEDEPIMLFVGRLTHAKGLKVLIDAFEQVLQTIPQMRLVLAGTHDPIFARVDIDHRLASRIIFTGHLNKEELEKWYIVSDIGIIPSYSEQCSFVAIEMMMHSMAIVYADSFGLRCMFEDGDNARIALRGENFAANLARSIIEVIEDRELQHKLQRNSLDCYQKKYSSEVMRSNYLRILNEIYK